MPQESSFGWEEHHASLTKRIANFVENIESPEFIKRDIDMINELGESLSDFFEEKDIKISADQICVALGAVMNCAGAIDPEAISAGLLATLGTAFIAAPYLEDKWDH